MQHIPHTDAARAAPTIATDGWGMKGMAWPTHPRALAYRTYGTRAFLVRLTVLVSGSHRRRVAGIRRQPVLRVLLVVRAHACWPPPLALGRSWALDFT